MTTGNLLSRRSSPPSGCFHNQTPAERRRTISSKIKTDPRQLNILQTIAFPNHIARCISLPASGRTEVPPYMGAKKKYGQAARLISTSQLKPSLALHTWPIYLVIFQEPLGALWLGTSHLVEGFTLRCLQRFSLPDVATRHYRWRDNRYTRGPSNPVLSY